MRNYVLFLLAGAALIRSADAQFDSTAVDSVLLKQIEQQLDAGASALPVASTTQTAASANPNISVIGDFRTQYNSTSTRHFDANLHETEFSFQSTIDPYAKADFFYSVSRNPQTGEFSGEIEEGYLTTLALPAHLQLKAGKFRSALGRINPVHPHALPFIDVPAAYRNFFGEDGINDEGLSLSWLIPNERFYQELTFQLTDGPRDNPSFHRSATDHYLQLAHLKNFWDLDDNTTLELGISGITGQNDSLFTTEILAGDLTLKWKPVRLNTYHSLTWQSEFYYSSAGVSDSRSVKANGFYSLLNFQVAQRWFVCGRYDFSNQPFNQSYRETAYSLTAGWYATEFQKIELEGKTTAIDGQSRNYEALVRWIFVIGSHGAHMY